jgi:hypothetical protein
MTNNPNQLSSNKIVLSEQSSLLNSAVPDGLVNEKPRLTSKSDVAKIAAISQALKYGQRGKNWVFQIVKTGTGPVQWTAFDLLWQSSDETAKQELLKYSPLRSEVGIDYTQLRDLLIAEKWEEADGETKRVMLKASGREKEGMLDRESIEKFPSQDLLTIDRLWRRYSKERFGFSVQKRIWQSISPNQHLDTESSGQRRFSPQVDNQVKEFGDRIGWRVGGNWLYFRELTFDTCALEGHLPSPSFATPCEAKGEDQQAIWGKWCAAFCFGGVRCGVLFLGLWCLLSRPDL